MKILQGKKVDSLFSGEMKIIRTAFATELLRAKSMPTLAFEIFEGRKSENGISTRVCARIVTHRHWK